MTQLVKLQARPDADHWLRAIFSAQTVARGSVVRRSIRWVEHEVGRDRLLAEVKRRGFHLVECGDQYLIICHNAGLRILC
jgi:hypothetical protein